jgi:hypothetical protein
MWVKKKKSQILWLIMIPFLFISPNFECYFILGLPDILSFRS